MQNYFLVCEDMWGSVHVCMQVCTRFISCEDDQELLHKVPDVLMVDVLG